MASFTLKSFSPIDKFLSTPIPEILWHYTSIEGLSGIVEQKEFWASDIRFLNDSSEMAHGLQILTEHLSTIALAAQVSTADSLIKSVLETNLQSGLFNEMWEKNELYVASFSKHGDQLSQWRGYTPKGKGVSLGFNLIAIRPPKEVASLAALAPCIYDADDKAQLLEEVFAVARSAYASYEAVINDLVKRGKELDPTLNAQVVNQSAGAAADEFKDTFNSLSGNLFRVLAFFKHAAFSEEGEWRYFAPLLKGAKTNSVKRFIRPKEFLFIPTVKFPLEQPDIPFPLTEVKVGPSPEQELVAESVRTLLRWNDLEHVVVTMSEIPFRP